MSWPTDALTGLFLFFLVFGLIFSVAALLLGAVEMPTDLPEADLNGDGGQGQSGTPSPFSLSTVMIFLTWFGAAGFALRTYAGAGAVASLLAAILCGLAGGALVWVFLAKVLMRGQTQLDPADYEIWGTPAQVTSSIRAGGTGEIVFMLDDKRRVDGARSADGAAIPAGAAVTILRYEAGIAYVSPAGEAVVDEIFSGMPIEQHSLAPPH